ncbi:MAG: hypothetical protein RQ833_11500 [Sphingomonadaceae bacterium]|nr:hypothetical protein [Sphingomonadaceae bacterium]
MANEVTDSQLSQGYVQAALLLYLAFASAPVRIAMGPMEVKTPAGLSGDDDLDSQSWMLGNSRVLSVGAVEQGASGSDSWTVTLSAIPTEAENVAAIDNVAEYAGRLARCWLVILNNSGTAIAWQHVATGYMSQVIADVSPEGMIATLTIENYTALFAAAPARTYLSQADFDPGDLSAAATLSMGQGALPDFQRGDRGESRGVPPEYYGSGYGFGGSDLPIAAGGVLPFFDIQEVKTK